MEAAGDTDNNNGRMSHVRGSVTNNNGFWIGFIEVFFYNLA
jgi:hypothetical protein